MIERILVAVDGSEGSRKAARHAIWLSRQLDARLVLLTVLEPPTLVPFGPLDAYALGRRETDEQVEAVRRLLSEVAAELPPEKVEQRVELGVPAEVICEQAQQVGANLVVVGSHGHGQVGRWLMGSVSDRVVHHARVPVMVVR